MAEYLIGIDIGTQGTKAALFDRELATIAVAFEPSKLISPEPGTVWQEPDDLYDSCVAAVRRLMEQSGAAPGEIAAIGLDGQMAGIMGVDENCEATTCYDSWLDMRCGKYMDEMNHRAGDRIVAMSGGPVTYVHGPKILWWKHEQPEAYEKTARFVLPHTYVVGRMAGLRGDEIYFDYTHLHFSCFADNHNKTWATDILNEFGVNPDKMPRIISPFEVVGKTTARFAAAAGVAEGVPVVAGCGDTAASTFGAGMFTSGQVLDCAGTASVLCSMVDSYMPDVAHKTMTMMRSPIDGYWLPLAYINGGGMCVRWFRDNLAQGASYDMLEAEAAPIAPGSEGLLFVPHFSGRVLPNDPHLKGSFLGLDFKHSRGHLYRAVMEAVAYEYRYYLSVLHALYPESAFDQLTVIGGGANSPLFNQIKANVLGVGVETFQTGDTALIGSAVIAGCGVGLLQDYAAPIRKVMERKAAYAADPAATRAYAPCAEAYLKAIGSISAFYRAKPYGA